MPMIKVGQCYVPDKVLEGIKAGFNMSGPQYGSVHEAAYQDIIASLNRRGCLTNKEAEELVKQRLR